MVSVRLIPNKCRYKICLNSHHMVGEFFHAVWPIQYGEVQSGIKTTTIRKRHPTFYEIWAPQFLSKFNVKSRA